MRRVLAAGVVAVAVVVAAGAALAAPAPQPVIDLTTTPTDPANYAWVSDDGRKALATLLANRKSGMVYAYAFAAAPGGNYWTFASAIQRSDFVSVADLARRSLEICEATSYSPCYLVSINGFDVRDAAGGLEIQPYLLASQPSDFDPERVPFVNATSWPLLHGYLNVTKAKALVLTTGGNWWYDVGDDAAQAVAAAYADCQKANTGSLCLLYAVNSRVVFTADGPH